MPSRSRATRPRARSCAVPVSADPSADRLGGHASPLDLLALLAAVVARLPGWALTALGQAVGWFAGSVLRYRRAHVEHAMRRAGVADVRGQARSMYRALGVSMVEVLSLGASARATSRARVDPASLERFRDARAPGRT